MVKVIDETEKDLRALIEKDFGPLEAGTDFSGALRDWLHYKARSIPRRPRTVRLSAEVKALRGKYPAIRTIASELRKGGDVTPWLSNSVWRTASNPKADMMFNDWQIMHFHIGGFYERPNKIKRSPDLLFAFMDSDRAVLLDVQPHGSWTMQNLLRILLRESPNDMEWAELKGVLGSGKNYTDDEALQLRKSGMNVSFEIERRCFISPGFGITSSKHATRLVRAADKLEITIAKLRDAIEKNELPKHLLSEITNNISLWVRLGVKFENGQLALYDKARNLNLVFFPAPH